MSSVLKSWYQARRRAWRDLWRDGIRGRHGRFAAHLDMNLVDHAVLRRFWTNRGTVAEGVYRSNQPSPRMIARLADEGIRTIVNLRGPSHFGSYALEREACERHGITLIDFRLYSRGMPRPHEIHALKDVFDTAERPMLLHCKSGADRAGIGSALYILLNGGTPEEAQAHLSFRYLHISNAKTGLLDHFVQAYADFNARTPTPFLDWVDHHYDRKTLEAEFQPGGLSEFVVSRLLHRE